LFSSPDKRSLILSLLLLAATLALYNQVSRHPFVNYDDDRYVTSNYHVRAGLTWQTVRWAFTSEDQANWHPLTWISHALDWELFGLNPAGHHYVNLLLHAANALLLFLLLQWTTGFTWRSWMVAALFAFHPLNVETVAWVAERKNVLSMLFFLLALWSYAWYARKPGVLRYAAVALLFALGLMAKPQVITFPFVLLLWDYWPLQRMFPAASNGLAESVPGQPAPTPFLWLLLEKIPLLLLALGSAIITLKAQAAGGAVRSVREFSLRVRLDNALVAYLRYIGKTVWPARLAPMYPHPGDLIPRWQVLAALLVLLAVTAAVLVARRRRYLAVGWFWFLGTLVPMIGLVQVGEAAMADRYAYLSVLGLFIVVCWGASDWAKRQHFSPRWLAVTSAVVLACLAAATYRQLGYWRDNVTLWTHTIHITRNNFIAEDNLGGALILLGRTDEAMAHFRIAAKISSWDPVANLNLAADAQEHGHLREAVELYGKVLHLTSDSILQSTTLNNLGSAFIGLGDTTAAQASYEESLRLIPQNAHAWIGLGLLAERKGDHAQAADRFSHSIAIQPSDVGYALLGRALLESGHAQEAAAAYQQGQHISPDWMAAQQAADRLLGK
jgi:tetratricopeptide (TPR) repeat protein